MKKKDKNHEKKHTVNITQWKDGILDVMEHIVDSFDDAIEYIKEVIGTEVKVKIYNCYKHLVHSETVNSCHGNGHGHGHHHHCDCDYEGHHDHDCHGNDHKKHCKKNHHRKQK